MDAAEEEEELRRSILNIWWCLIYEMTWLGGVSAALSQVIAPFFHGEW